MSLAVLADHMASKGRGPDSMLIHMSPREVQGLQALAVKNGGSLTVNPNTGLPEAGFLDKLLPAIIGGGISYFSGGSIDPITAAAMVGGVETVRTGDLGKGISAGLGAYGGAGLAAGFAGAGTGALSLEAGNAALSQAGLTGEAAVTLQADQVASQAIGDRLASATPFDKLSAGAKAVTSSPSALGSFAKDNFKYLALGAAPILADQAIKSNMPTTTTSPGQMRTFSYDPYGQRYTPTGNYQVPRKAEEKEETAADGGLMGMDNGGYSPGQLNFAERSEPVVRMAAGGTGGLDYQTLVSSLQNSPLTAEQRAAPSPQYQATIDYSSPSVSDDMVQRAYQDVWGRAAAPWEVEAWQGVAGDATETALSKAPIQAQVGDIYRNVLGRDADPGGLENYTNQIAAFNPVMLSAGQRPDQVYENFLADARTRGEIFNTDPTRFQDYASAVTPYTGYQSADQTNIVDEWVRNTLGREVTAADKEQAWYKDAFKTTQTIPGYQDLYGQFQNYARTDSTATNAQKIREATASLAARGMTEADVLRQTGKTVAQLVASDIDVNKDLFTASQLRAPGARAGFNFNSIQNPYGNATNPGDKTYNPDGSITVTPNIPGRPSGGFSGMDEVKNAYTAGGGSLGYTPNAPKTMEEFNKRFNKQTGGSKQAYDYLMGKSNYSTTPYTPTGEVMKPYSESVLGAPVNITSKKVLFDPVTRKYKVNPDYIPVTYTPEGKRVVGVSDREVANKLTSTTAATGGLLSLAGGGSAMDTTSDYGKWLKDNNVSIEQVARALGISVAEARKRYETKGGAKDTGMDLGGPKLDSGTGSDAMQPRDKKTEDYLTWEESTVAGKEARAARMGEVNNLLTLGIPGAALAAKLSGRPISMPNFSVLFGTPQSYQDAVAAQQDALAQSQNQALNAMSGRQETQMNAEPGSFSGVAPAAPAGVEGLGTGDGGLGGGGGRSAGDGTGAGGNQSGNESGEGLGTGDGGMGGGGGRSAGDSPLAHGGLTALAQGGMYNLGDYSDGGRLLRGPGDGVSDSIPATIGKKRPARLADGEFVVPARIVSELGNGSTEAGARKLYAMMDRIQAARRSSIGKGKVAKNSRADKYLPA